MNTPLIDPSDPGYRLGHEQMDATHRAFIDLVNRLDAADKVGFIALFAQLVDHTREHFASEDELMIRHGFPAIREHQSEHQRVLGELDRMASKLVKGSTALPRAYVREQLPHWFSLHASTMDSALAAQINGCARVQAIPNPSTLRES